MPMNKLSGHVLSIASSVGEMSYIRITDMRNSIITQNVKRCENQIYFDNFN